MGLFHSINTSIHITAGAIALFIGLFLLFSVKGSQFHRHAGKYFIPFGAIVAITAVLGVALQFSHSTLAAISLSAGYQFISSLRALSLRNRTPQIFDALLALCTIALALFMLLTSIQGSSSFIPAIGYSALGYVMLIATYDLSRHAWADYWLGHIRPIDHGLKMTGFYFSMLSAGVGNVLHDFQPWSQIIPSVLGIITLLIFAFLFFRKTYKLTNNAKNIK